MLQTCYTLSMGDLHPPYGRSDDTGTLAYLAQDFIKKKRSKTRGEHFRGEKPERRIRGSNKPLPPRKPHQTLRSRLEAKGIKLLDGRKTNDQEGKGFPQEVSA